MKRSLWRSGDRQSSRPVAVQAASDGQGSEDGRGHSELSLVDVPTNVSLATFESGIPQGYTFGRGTCSLAMTQLVAPHSLQPTIAPKEGTWTEVIERPSK